VTDRSDLPTALAPPPPPQLEPRRFAQPAAPEAGTKRTGVVWVHGIGTQVERETLFDWTRPIIDVFGEWRRQYDQEHREATIGENPVGSASVTDPSNPWIEVDIPAFHERPREQWLFTEAFWAGDVRPPSFAVAAKYLLKRLPVIVQGITDGYGLREPRRTARLEDLRERYAGDPRLTELNLTQQQRWEITDTLDGLWQQPAVRWTLGIVGSAIGLLVLGVYTLLRTITIPPLQKRIELAAADTFIVQWFGDLPVILDDQSQSAAIRTRLVERVRWLRDRGCDDIVLLAHSGGTIVSYATLLRYAHDEFPVAKLITFGEAIKLGWRLERDTRDWYPGNSVRGNVAENHPDLRWVDIWASYDPAPAGELTEVDGCPLIAVEKLGEHPEDPRIHVESRPVTNFMHLGLDHGGYWANDEGFLIPVIRHIDDARGDGSRARFYRDPLDRTLRTERRRRRVALLLGWRWTALGAAIAAFLGIAIGPADLVVTGTGVAGVWNVLPGHELVSGPVHGVGEAIGAVFAAVGPAGLADGLAPIGAAIVGAIVPIVAIWTIYSRGVGSWMAHDALERERIRGERLKSSGLPSARSEATALVGGLLAVVLAAWSLDGRLIVLWLVAAAVLGLAIRARRPPETETDRI